LWFNAPRESASFIGQHIEPIERYLSHVKKFHPVFRLASSAFLHLLTPPTPVQ
jgi:hypothetical protein